MNNFINNNYEYTAIVPVRSGSQRVPGKNLRSFSGEHLSEEHSLLSWKINQLKSTLPKENIIVSSDWDLALTKAEDLGVKAIKRSDELSSSDASFDEVIFECASKVNTKYTCWTPVTSPFLGSRTLSRAIDVFSNFSEDLQKEGLIAVNQLSSYCFLGNSPINFPIGSGHLQTQEISPIQVYDWALSIRSTLSVLEDKYMFSNTPHFFDVNLFENFDINTEMEFKMSQKLIPLYLEDNGYGEFE